MVRWTAAMLVDLQNCRSKALELRNSENPPLKADGKKTNYLDILQELWNNKGYTNLGISKDNLRVRANQLKSKILTNAKLVREEILSQRNSNNDFNAEIVQDERNGNSGLNGESSSMCNQSEDTIATVQGEFPGDTERNAVHLNREERQLHDEIMEKATRIMSTIVEPSGEFGARKWHTRTRISPTASELKILNTVAYTLWEECQENIETESAGIRLWHYNCVIYATAAAWLLKTGKAKERNDKQMTERSAKIPNWLRKLEKEIAQVRREISIASAEIYRLQNNGKLTKKGKKNQKHLREERKVKICCSSLYAFIEKQKASLKRLARKRRRKLKQERSKRWNNTYTNQPTRIHDALRQSISNDPENLRPKLSDYIKSANQQEEPEKCFESLLQAETFWRPIWENEGKGDPNATWLREIEIAMDDCCGDIESQIEGYHIRVNEDQIAKVIRKKRNWSAPGPDVICNYWVKKITVLHS